MIHLLLVDDEPLLLVTAKTFLEKANASFECDTANSAQEALEKLATISYDAIVSDYEMPKMDGIGLLKEVRARLGNLPFILYTGKGREAVVIEAINHGADFYVQKGSDPRSEFAELAHKIRHAVKHRRAEQKIHWLAQIPLQNPHPVMRVERGGAITFANPASAPVLETWGVDTREAVPPAIASLIESVLDEDEIREVDIECKESVYSLTFSPFCAEHCVNIYGKDITERTRAEGALRESEERFRAVVENSLDSVYRLNMQANYFDYMSPVIEQIVGFTPDEMNQMSIDEVLDRIHPDDRRSVTGELARAVASGRGIDEYRFRAKDGHYRWLADHFAILSDRDGHPLYRGGVVRDITGRKQADEALRRSESRYRTLVENIHDVVYSYSLDGHLTYISPNVQTYFGYTPSEMIGHSLFEYVHPEDREAVLRDFQRTMTTLEEFTSYCRLIQKDGSVSHVEEIARKVVDGAGNIIGYSGVIRDITERKQTEEALQESEERYRAVVENSLDAVYRRDLQTDRYDYMSPAIEQIIGFTPDEMNQMSIDEVLDRIHPDDRRPVDAELAHAVASGRGIIEYRFRANDGQYRWLADHFTVLRDRDGRPLYRGGVVREITARKQAEKALKDASNKLNLLTSITRHDILNQVTALKGFLALMQDPLQSNAESEEMFHTLEKIADTIRRQITFTADYEEMGERDPEWQLVEWVVKRAAKSVRLNGVSLAVDTGTLEIFADPMLEKVFYNLLDNAVVHGERVEHISVSFHEDGDAGVLVVEDDGTGVPASMKTRIFERGFGTVTGYGLFLGKEILDITGISIRETGEEGKGARFEIEVPAGKWRMCDGESTGHESM